MTMVQITLDPKHMKRPLKLGGIPIVLQEKTIVEIEEGNLKLLEEEGVLKHVGD